MGFRNKFIGILLCATLGVTPAQAGCADYLAGLFSFWKKNSPSEKIRPPEHTKLGADQETIRRARKLNPDDKIRAIQEYAAPRKKSWIEKSTVIFDYLAVTYLGIKVMEGFQENPHALIPALLLTLPVLYMADLAGQVFHKWLDSYASEDNRLWGAAAREFRKHHEFPDNLNDVDYLSHVSPFGVLLAPAFALAATSAGTLPPEIGAATGLFLVCLLNTTEFHKQTHLREPSFLFKWLQKARLALNRKEHLIHHRPPFDSEYAVMNGWSNAFARRIDLWNRLDVIFWRFWGRLPHNWVQDPSSIPPEVVERLKADLNQIPSDLWDYASTFPQRVHEDLKEPIREAKLHWRNRFIQERRKLYLALEQAREITEKEWKKEQSDFPWLYGSEFIPLEE